MKKVSLTINIYDYTDYRKFLRDAYEDLNNQDSNISYRYLQRRAGYSIKSNHFWQLIKGRIPLSQKAANRFGAALGLNFKQTQYLATLACFSHANSDLDKNHYLEQLKQFNGFKNCNAHQINYEFYEDWKLPALRELINLDDFREDGNWISHRLRYSLTPMQAMKGLDRLVSLGYLKRDKQGKLVQADPFIGNFENRTNDNPTASLAIRNFHRKMIQMGTDCIEELDQTQRLVLGTTVSISRKQAEAIKKLTVEFMQQVEAIVLEDEPVETVQRLNIQMFPLSKEK